MYLEKEHANKDDLELAMSEKPTYKQLEARIIQLELELRGLRGNHKEHGSNSKKDLRLSTEQFRLAFETSPDAINVNRISDGTYIEVNEGFSRITGYRREELLKTPDIHLTIWKNIKDRERLTEGLRASGYVANLEAQFIAKDGTTKYGLLSARVVQLGDEKVLLSITRDITDIKHAQQKLAESEKRLRTFIENSPDSFFAHDRKGRIIQVNEKACSSLGYSRDELNGMSILDIERGASPETAEKLWKKVVKGEVITFEGSHKKKDGATFPVEVRLSSVHLNEEILIFGFARDISERRAMEAEQERIRRQLILAQRLEAIGTLAGGVAHDFNNLLMGIQGRASLISYDLDSSHPCFEHVKAITEYTRSAANLTKQLLGIARGGKYDAEPIDLNAVLLESATIFGRTKKEIQIHSKPHDPPPVVVADHRQIEQVLLNLYINAWQAMPDGGELYLQTDIVSLNADFCKTFDAKPGRYAKISVTDTGIGMDPKTLSQIFDPFFTTKEKGRGTGLGLSSAYGIIKNHGGVITAHSEPEQGTTFNLYLPVTHQPAAKDQPSQTRLTKGAETILIVDDEEMILEVAQAMLGRLGYRTIQAKGGRAAIAELKKGGNNFDLVILDLIMPEMSGEKTFDAIRKINPSIPVIIASGYAIESSAGKILQKGCNGFIQKPYNLEELSRKIRQVIEAAKTAEESCPQ